MYETGNEYCPKCGESWYGDCPKSPLWIEYRCENPECRYSVGEDYYTGERMIIKDSLREGGGDAMNKQEQSMYDDLIECLERVGCQFEPICDGPTRKPVNMATCYRCRLLYRHYKRLKKKDKP